MKKQIFISLAVIAFLAIGTVVAVLYGEGYRFDLNNTKSFVRGTGLLVTTSTPDGALVSINDHPTTATNNTINLAPGDYNVKITKEGYFPWQKKIHVEKEVVSKAEALLFPTTPKLESITSLGVNNPIVDPTDTKIVFTVASQSAKKNGVYILDMGNRSLLTLQAGTTQIADETVVSFANATLSWSPDGKNVLASVPNGISKPTIYLLDATTFNQSPKDVTETLATVQAGWDKIKTDTQIAQINTLKPELRKFITSSANILAWSPDETKFIYTASQSATLPQIIKPALIGADSTPEVRNLTEGNVYVYDTKEDKNFQLATSDNFPSQKIMWFPDSKHLIVVHNRRIDVREYDSTNNTTLYAGPFMDGYVFPWPTADQIVMLTNLNNPDIPANLYTISLK